MKHDLSYSKRLQPSDLTKSIEDDATDGERDVYLLEVLLHLIDLYVQLVPSLAARANFDLTRLLDELLPWPARISEEDEKGEISTNEAAVSGPWLTSNLLAMLPPILSALRQGTVNRQCRWFGSREDAVKLVSQLVVASDWTSAVRRTSLGKLLVLSGDGEALSEEGVCVWRNKEK